MIFSNSLRSLKVFKVFSLSKGQINHQINFIGLNFQTWLFSSLSGRHSRNYFVKTYFKKELANYSRPSQTYRQMANDLDFDDELFDRIFDKHFQWSKNGFLKNSRLTDANRNRNKNWKINPQNQSPLGLPPNKKMVRKFRTRRSYLIK